MNDELLIGLVSISDRASSGVYEDKGIPARVVRARTELALAPRDALDSR